MRDGRMRLARHGRKALLCAGLAVTLGGCAQLDEWFPWLPWAKPAEQAQAAPEAAPPPPPAEAEKPKPVKRAPAKPAAPPPEPEIAMVDPGTLVGLRPGAVGKLLGTPDSIAKQEMSLIWTYSADGCALKVYFYPDLKTSDFHVLKFSLAGEDGKPLDKEAPCRRKLLALKTNDAG